MSQVVSAVPLLDFLWVGFATFIIALGIPLLALRWTNVVATLVAHNERMTATTMIVITAIWQFFAQVLPSVAGDGVRAWLLARLGCDWRNAVASVVIDRAIGAGVLIALGIRHPAVAVRPRGARRISRRHALGLWRASPRGGLGLLLTTRLAARLACWRYSRWLASLAMSARQVVLGPKGAATLAIACLIHLLERMLRGDHAGVPDWPSASLDSLDQVFISRAYLAHCSLNSLPCSCRYAPRRASASAGIGTLAGATQT